MKTIFRISILGSGLLFMLLLDVAGLQLVPEAHAIAGVRRRTARWTAVVVGSTSAAKGAQASATPPPAPAPAPAPAPGAVIAGAGSVFAADPASTGKWEGDVAVYLWGASIAGTTATDNDVSVSFGDLLDNLDMAFMVSGGAQKGNWSVLADLIYLDVEANQDSTESVGGNPVDVSTDVELKGAVINLTGGYAAVQTDRQVLNLLAGVRYLDLETDLSFDIGGTPDSFSGSGDALDFIIGLQGRAGFAKSWFFSYYLDLGTGDTDFTWQGVAGFNYRFKHLEAGFGYRYLEWSFDKGDPFARAFDDLEFSGPYGGVRFLF